MVDDFAGQGGTLKNLCGWVERPDGTVVGVIGCDRVTGYGYRHAVEYWVPCGPARTGA